MINLLFFGWGMVGHLKFARLVLLFYQPVFKRFGMAPGSLRPSIFWIASATPRLLRPLQAPATLPPSSFTQTALCPTQDFLFHGQKWQVKSKLDKTGRYYSNSKQVGHSIRIAHMSCSLF